MFDTHRETPFDPALPQLSVALDTPIMQSVLGTALLDSEPLRARFRVRGCSIGHIRYKPRKNCLITYRLALYDTLTQRDEARILCAKLFEHGGSAARFAKAQQQVLVAPAIGQALLHVPELEMVVWTFPNDRKLAGLPVLIDPDRLRGEILPPIVEANWGGAWKLAKVTSEVVHYVAEHTCTLRAQLHLVDQDTDAVRAHTVYGKVYYNDQGALAYERMRELWHSAARRAGQLGMAEPLGYQAQPKILWQRGLAGTTLLDRDPHTADFRTLLAQAAAAVAALHQSAVICTSLISSAVVLDAVFEAARMLSSVRPSCAVVLDRLVQRLTTQARALRDRPAAVLHGDPHLQNFFVTSGSIALIDLDNVCLGNPLHDLGSFIAGLYARGLHDAIAPHTVEQMIDSFVHAYAQHVPWAVLDTDLAWYIAAALIGERALRCVTRLKAGRLAIIDDLVELADRISRQPLRTVGATAVGDDHGSR